MGRFEAALGAEDQFAKLASCTFATASLGNTVSMLSDETGGISNCHAQAYAPNDRQVWQIVPQEGDLFVA